MVHFKNLFASAVTAVALVLGLSMMASSASAQERGNPDRIRFRFGVDHGVGIGFPEVEPTPCSHPGCLSWNGIGNGFFAAHGTIRFGVQLNRHFALSMNQGIWLISDEILSSTQLMAEWMPLDILQLGIAVGYDYEGDGGPSATLRAALNLSGRQSGARRDGLMLVFTSHAAVIFEQHETEVVHAYTLGLGYDYY